MQLCVNLFVCKQTDLHQLDTLCIFKDTDRLSQCVDFILKCDSRKESSPKNVELFQP